jgi:hypothetical protein
LDLTHAFREVNMFKRYLATTVCALLPVMAMMFSNEKPAGASLPAVVEQPSVVEPPATEPQSAFDVSILVDGVPLQEYYARGRTYIEATEGQEYSVRIHNPLGVRVAVALTVDGMNSIDARRTSAYDASKWVIEPYGDVTISGWQMSGSRARRFYFTTERDSFGAKLGRTANLGVISAVFFRENRPVPVPITPRRSEKEYKDDMDYSDQDAPSESRAQSDSSGARAKSLPAPSARKADEYAATGIGRSVRNDVRWLNLDLQRDPVASVSFRYEYRPELVRLGVLPRPYNPDPIERREKATGFRDGRYSPEP